MWVAYARHRPKTGAFKMQTTEETFEPLVLGDAKALTNSPTGDREQELNPDEKYDE